MAHILVIANETAASQTLLDALRGEAGGRRPVTVIAPVNEPTQGYVVYEDTRRASAGRRLERTLKALDRRDHGAGLRRRDWPGAGGQGRARQLEPEVDEIVVSTHGAERSGWMRRNVVGGIKRGRAGVPVRHVVVGARARGEANVLVIANQTVVSDELLDRIRKRAAQSPASFLIVAPQSDDEEHADADRRLRRALSLLRGEGIDAHGQVVHPDPYTAARHAINDERVDELIVSTFPGERSGWLRRDLVERLRKDTKLPVEHVISPVRQEVRDECRRGGARRPARAAADPLQLARHAGRARHVPVHRVGDHALRLVLHGLLLRSRREPRCRRPLAADRFPPSGVRCADQHADPRHLELHDALGGHVGEEGQPRGPAGRALPDALPRARPSC